MAKRYVFAHASLNALATALYVIAIISFISLLEKGPDNNILIPIAMLMLFVFSAAFTGYLVFGRPIIWFLEGKKQEAISLLFYTLGILFILTVIIFLIVLMS